MQTRKERDAEGAPLTKAARSLQPTGSRALMRNRPPSFSATECIGVKKTDRRSGSLSYNVQMIIHINRLNNNRTVENLLQCGFDNMSILLDLRANGRLFHSDGLIIHHFQHIFTI